MWQRVRCDECDEEYELHKDESWNVGGSPPL
jgi:hypothetical protein